MKTSSRGLRIAASGMYVPKRILTNADLEKIVDTSDEWIFTRTGIRERHLAAPDESTSDMATKAALEAIQRAKIKPEDIDLVMVATLTPDTFFPATACHIQARIGATRAAAFDLSAACSGFLYGLVIADQFIRTGVYKNILIIGAERLSSVVDWKDRNTCVLFGDGAGAVVVHASTESSRIIAQRIGANGLHHEMLYMKNNRSVVDIQNPIRSAELDFIHMSGKEVFKQAVNAMYHAAVEVMKEAHVTIDDLRCVITHQANNRIIEALADKLKLPAEKCFVNVHKYGNISAACIPVALREAEEFYPLKRGDKILLIAFGGGLTWGAVLLEW